MAEKTIPKYKTIIGDLLKKLKAGTDVLAGRIYLPTIGKLVQHNAQKGNQQLDPDVVKVPDLNKEDK